MAITNWRVTQAIVENNMSGFRNMVEHDEQVLEQKVGNATVLHLVSRIGNHEMVSLVLELRPDMETVLNDNLETPLHVACRMGHGKVVKLLMDKNQWVASNLNRDNQSALFLACSYGHLKIVDLLLNHTSWLLDVVDLTTCLHVAVSKGRTDIAKKLLEKCPDLANLRDKNGSLALHCACRRGHLGISKLLLGMDPDHALQFDNNGYTPLHLAAINGNLGILEEFASTSPLSFQLLSKHGENVFHLTIRFNKFDAFKCVNDVLKGTNLFHQSNKFGNTIQHHAQMRGLNRFVEYINQMIAKEQTDNEKDGNHRDILNQTELPTTSENVINENNVTEIRVEAATLEDETCPFQKVKVHRNTGIGSETCRKEEKEIKRLKNILKKEHLDLHREALQNARNTITLVAILIATVTFTAGINPPGGVYQEGLLKGKAIMGKKQAFKIFAISNHIALFVSLCIVVVLVSIIPFKRKPLKRILAAAHKVTWVAVSFMAVSYVAATWVIMPMLHDNRTVNWILEALLSICAGTLGFTFFSLGVMLIKHQMKKNKWRKGKLQLTVTNAREIKVANLQNISHSTNSDVCSLRKTGFYPL